MADSRFGRVDFDALDKYVAGGDSLDAWAGRLRRGKLAAKAAVDASKEDAIVKTQRQLTRLRTRAGLSILRDIDEGRAHPSLLLGGRAIPPGRFLIQLFSNDEGFKSAMQLHWQRDEGGALPTDEAGVRQYLAALGQRFHRHALLTREQQQLRETSAREKVLKHTFGLYTILARASQSPIKFTDTLPALGAAVDPDEHDVTYSPDHRNVYRVENEIQEQTGPVRFTVRMQITCANRRASHPSLVENQGTAEFYNATISPVTARWVEVDVLVGGVIYKLKIREFLSENSSFSSRGGRISTTAESGWTMMTLLTS